jgi:hypothetical protein
LRSHRCNSDFARAGCAVAAPASFAARRCGGHHPSHDGWLAYLVIRNWRRWLSIRSSRARPSEAAATSSRAVLLRTCGATEDTILRTMVGSLGLPSEARASTRLKLPRQVSSSPPSRLRRYGGHHPSHDG